MEHGGYAAVFQITEIALNQSIKVLHRAGEFPDPIVITQTINEPGGNSGQATVAVHLWMDAPVVTLSTANDGFVVVKVRLFGNTAIVSNTAANGIRDLRIELVIRTLVNGQVVQNTVEDFFGPIPVNVQTTYDLIATFVPVSVIATQVNVINGADFPLAWVNYFSSFQFHAGLGFALAQVLQDIPTMIPAQIAPFFRALNVGNGVTAQIDTGVGNGYLNIGLNISSTLPSLSINGSMPSVPRFLGTGDIAVVINEAAAPLLARQMRLDMNDQISSAEIKSLNIKFKPGYLAISGNADATFGSANFSFRATPIIGRPGWQEVIDDEYGQWSIWHEPSDEIWLDITNLQLDANPYWWSVLTIVGGLAILGPGFAVSTGGYAPIFFLNIIHELLVGARIRIVEQGQAPLISANQQIALLDEAEPEFRLKLKSINIFEDRVRTRASFKPLEGGYGHITGPGAIDVFDTIDEENKFTFRLQRHPLVFHPDDPEIRVRWQIRRHNSTHVYKTYEKDASDENPFRIRIKLSDLNLGTSSVKALLVNARVYRSGGTTGNAEYWNASLVVPITDRIDRTYPYVKWSHHVITPNVVKNAQGKHQQVGWQKFKRHSVIHRTDVPGRCKFVSQYTTKIKHPTYLDELPFEITSIHEHRDEVCDFCFYGGPQSKELKENWSGTAYVNKPKIKIRGSLRGVKTRELQT